MRSTLRGAASPRCTRASLGFRACRGRSQTLTPATAAKMASLGSATGHENNPDARLRLPAESDASAPSRLCGSSAVRSVASGGPLKPGLARFRLGPRTGKYKTVVHGPKALDYATPSAHQEAKKGPPAMPRCSLEQVVVLGSWGWHSPACAGGHNKCLPSMVERGGNIKIKSEAWRPSRQAARGPVSAGGRRGSGDRRKVRPKSKLP